MQHEGTAPCPRGQVCPWGAATESQHPLGSELQRSVKWPLSGAFWPFDGSEVKLTVLLCVGIRQGSGSSMLQGHPVTLPSRPAPTRPCPTPAVHSQAGSLLCAVLEAPPPGTATLGTQQAWVCRGVLSLAAVGLARAATRPPPALSAQHAIYFQETRLQTPGPAGPPAASCWVTSRRDRMRRVCNAWGSTRHVSWDS